MFRGSEEERRKNLNQFYEITEKDIINGEPGKLVIDNSYIQAYITASSTYPDENNYWTTKNVKILCPYPFWITEENRSFPSIAPGEEMGEYLDYEYDHEYDYTMTYGGDIIWKVEHFAPCEFLMTIFGPTVDPRIVINGHAYQIYTTLDENEYLQINSRKNTVIKYMANGIRQDIYDYRSKQQSVFEQITPGDIRVVWQGDFGFDLTLFCERSEPKWKMKGN